MIEFRNVSKSYRSGLTRKHVLRDASFTLPARNIAILGMNGAGKSTLIRMLAAAELPDRGEIRREVEVSWPLGFGGGFHGSLTGIENLRFICRIYGRRMDDVIKFVEDFAELGQYFHMPVKTYSAGMRARLAFAVSMAIDFDCYLIDEITAVGDARFQERCAAEFARKRQSAKIIMVSHSQSTVRKYCDMGCVLTEGRLDLYDDLEKAIAAYAETMKMPVSAMEDLQIGTAQETVE